MFKSSLDVFAVSEAEISYLQEGKEVKFAQITPQSLAHMVHRKQYYST